MRQSVGILIFRRKTSNIEVFLVHPGGPYWAKKDLGAWGVPKGEYHDGEEPLTAARREFFEETGFACEGNFISLGEVQQRGGKHVHAWAVEADCDPAQLVSNTFSLQWPPRSGRFVETPEVDRGEWFNLQEARRRMVTAQIPFLEALAGALKPTCPEASPASAS